MAYLRIIIAFMAMAIFGLAVPQTKTIVKPLDAVKVVCEEEPSLSKDYKITRDGYIVMQFIGAVNVAGLKEDAAAAKISATLIEQRILPRATVSLKILGGSTASLISYSGAVTAAGEMYPRPGLRLSDVVKEAKPTGAADMENVRVIPANGTEILVNYAAFDGKDMAKNPEVRAGDRVVFDLVVRVKDISVTGLVKKPGVVPFSDGMKVIDAISAAGGLAQGGDLAAIRLERAGKTVDGRRGEATLEAGDSVFVPQLAPQGFVQINGAVSNPGPVSFRQGLTLVQALTSAGGFKPGANAKKVKVIRTIDGKAKSVEIDVEAIAQGRASDYPLRTDDQISVSGGKKRNDNVLKVAAVALGGLLFGIFKF